MSTSTILFYIAFLFAVVGGAYFGALLPGQYHNRSCQGKGWRLAFPDASKEEIRAFLEFFMEAFGYAKKEKLKLSPDDQLLEIYRKQYPYRWQPDQLEFETLASDLDTEYGLDFSSIWKNELTLGELFSEIHSGAKH